MKTLKTLLVLACIYASAIAQQLAIAITVRDGVADIALLDNLLEKGWKVVCATPVQSGNGSVPFTRQIIYILELEKK